MQTATDTFGTTYEVWAVTRTTDIFGDPQVRAVGRQVGHWDNPGQVLTWHPDNVTLH